jgi:hypothetical protein
MSKRHQRQIELYVRKFAGYIKWYPSSFRHQYAEEMTQLLRDQLQDAAESGDEQMVQEVFHQAVYELPGSILKERLMSPINVADFLESKGISSWRAFSIAYFAMVAATVYGMISIDYVWLLVFLPVLVLGLLLTCWRYTGRFSLTSLVILTGLAGAFLGGMIADQIIWHYQGASSGIHYYTNDALISSLGVGSGGLILPYLLLAWFHLKPKVYARVTLAALSEEEREVLRETIQRRRKFVVRCALGLAALFVVLNLAGLYDPPVNYDDLIPAEHMVERNKNAYYIVERISVPDAVFSRNTYSFMPLDVRTYLKGKEWDNQKAAELLAATTEVRQLFSEAAALPDYQDPLLDSPYGFADRFAAAGFGQNDFSPASKLMLLDALYAYKHGDQKTAVDDIEKVMKLANVMMRSNHFYIAYYASTDAQVVGLSVMNIMIKEGLAPEQKSRLRSLIPENGPLFTALENSWKWEFYASQTQRPTWGSEGYGYMLLPFWYQPNRTTGLAAAQFRRALETVGTCPVPEENRGYSDTSLLTYVTYNGMGRVFASWAPASFGPEACSAIEAANQTRALLEI